jgi:hypothetical protein
MHLVIQTICRLYGNQYYLLLVENVEENAVARISLGVRRCTWLYLLWMQTACQSMPSLACGDQNVVEQNIFGSFCKNLLEFNQYYICVSIFIISHNGYITRSYLCCYIMTDHFRKFTHRCSFWFLHYIYTDQIPSELGRIGIGGGVEGEAIIWSKIDKLQSEFSS